jgi:F0F1-type ATP synthase assembly protein I
VEFVASHRVDPAAAAWPTAAARAGAGEGDKESVRAARLEERRQLFSGFGDALSLAIEFVATPLIFAAAGYFLDRWLGTDPYLTVALGAFALTGIVVAAYYQYRAAFEAEEAGKPWTRTKR